MQNAKPIDELCQSSTYLFEVPSWKFIRSQPWVGRIKVKTYNPSFPARRTIYFSVTENKFAVWNYRFSGPAGIYLFEFSNINSGIKCTIFSIELKIGAADVVPVSL